jgi:hypothetical protein
MSSAAPREVLTLGHPIAGLLVDCSNRLRVDNRLYRLVKGETKNPFLDSRQRRGAI